MIRKGYSYTAYNVKSHPTSKGDTFWSFSLRDDVEQGTAENKYQYYSGVTFSPVIMTDNCKYKIDNIVSVSTRMYNEKVYQNLNLEITVQDTNIP